MENQIIVYTQDNCMKCKMVKMMLDGEGIEYTEKYLETEEDKEAFKSMGYQSTPVTVKGEQVVIGFEREQLKGLA